MTTSNTTTPIGPFSENSPSPTITPTTPASQTPVNATSTNPNSRGVNDLSDIRPTPNLSPLPTRAEKRLIPTMVDATQIQQNFFTSSGGQLAQALGLHPQNTVHDTDFYTYAKSEARRLQNGVDYIKIRIPHRGVLSSSQLPDTSQAAEFRFLTNPSTLTVNRQTVDSQSMTRGGWQFGVWGEDTFLVSMQGTSAGSYFSLGTTDEFSYYAVSYRNLMQLQEVFENNGYWFEGEEYNEGPLAADYLRRRIRMHQDVELWCGNFIWSGMFDSFTISQDATQPFMLTFSLSFFVWKERYRTTSPYQNSIANNIERGHSYSAIEGQTDTTQTNNALAQFSSPSTATQAQLSSGQSAGVGLTLGSDGRYYPPSSIVNGNMVGPPATNQPYGGSPAIAASISEDLSPNVPTTVTDIMGVGPMNDLMFPQKSPLF